MHNLYGKRKLTAPEIKGAFTLSNGMYCVWGNPKDEGLSVDIYDDKSRKLLIGLEHGMMAGGNICSENLKEFIESYAYELEDSLVYYYGPRECKFEDADITTPVPPKTGRFA